MIDNDELRLGKLTHIRVKQYFIVNNLLVLAKDMPVI
jgi:hypothetical protein